MAPESGQAASEDEESLLRPAWEETADETDADRGLRPGPSRARSLGRTGGAEDLPSLLGPLCSAADALARLDARAAAAAGPVRDGLIARMAYLEAAGFLAHTHAWAHPLDLALRERGLTASTALAAVGAPHRALPQTFAATVNTAPWADPPLGELPAGDAVIAEALTLARALRRLADKAGVTAVASADIKSRATRAVSSALWVQLSLLPTSVTQRMPEPHSTVPIALRPA